MNKALVRLSVALVASTVVVACGGDAPTDGSGTGTIVTASSLFIDSIQPVLYVGRTAQLVFQVRDKSGAPLAGRTLVLASNAPQVATVSSTGLLTGVAAGSATITGTVDGISASRTIAVLPIPSAVLTTSPDYGFLARGVDLTLTSQVKDVDGNLLTGHVVTFTSSDPTIATVSASGIVHPVANGSVNVTGAVDGVPQTTSRFVVYDPRSVTGVVATSDGGALPALLFTARFNGGSATLQTISTSVDQTTGAFTLIVPAFTATGPSMEFYVDAAPGSQRTYHPAWIRDTPGLVPSGAHILLIPHFITIDSGTYAGQRLGVNMNDAFTPVCTDTTNANCQSYWPSYFLTGIKMWPDAARPVPLALDRTTGAIAASDSIALWTIIQAMETDLGRKLYRPVSFSAFTSTGYTLGEELVSYDPSLTGFSGFTNWSWDASSNITQARTRLAGTRYFSTSSIVTHELNHALGFHHTCQWPTVMGGYGCAQGNGYSSSDVAYWHLAEQVRRSATSFGATWSVTEALAGMRIFELGYPASSITPPGLSALFSRTFTFRSDGAP